MQMILPESTEHRDSFCVLQNNHAFKQITKSALALMAQWIEHWPADQRFTDLIPSYGCRPGSQWGGAQEATTY